MLLVAEKTLLRVELDLFLELDIKLLPEFDLLLPPLNMLLNEPPLPATLLGFKSGPPLSLLVFCEAILLPRNFNELSNAELKFFNPWSATFITSPLETSDNVNGLELPPEFSTLLKNDRLPCLIIGAGRALLEEFVEDGLMLL